MSEDWKKRVRLLSETGMDLDIAIEMVNRALVRDREFLESEYLPGDLEEYTKEFFITIKETQSALEMDMSPLSGEGHDFQFVILKVTGMIDQDTFCVGEVLPDIQDR